MSDILTNELVQEAITRLDAIPDFLKLMIISVVPCFGLRGGMVASCLLGVKPLIAMCACILGNFIPVPFIFIFVRFLMHKLKNISFLKNSIYKMEQKALSKSGTIKKFGFLGVILFVALPLPGTGAYSGALISAILNMPIKIAIAALIIGMVSSALIMSLILHFYSIIF